MDDSWHLKAAVQGLNRNYAQQSPVSASLNQIETFSGPFAHPFVQQEVCVIERTIRQESMGANLLNFGLQGPNVKSARGDIGNSLLALVPGSQHQVRSSYQSVVTPQSPSLFSSPQAFQMGPLGSPTGGWPGHLSNTSAGNRVGAGSSRLGADSSLNMPGREVTLSMLGREVNLTQFARMTAGQDGLESSLTRTSGVEMSKNNLVQDSANDISWQGPYPQWLTEIISSRQRGLNTQSTFPYGAAFPRVAESSRDDCTVMTSSAPFPPALIREARVVCINYDTGQKIGGDLYLTQFGLLGVICLCHGSHMSVAKFTQHVGIHSTNPGNVVAMDGTGESLVQWRKTLFSLYRIKVPNDNQGWNWSEGGLPECGPAKYKSLVTQSWQKELDVSYGGEPLVKSRLTQVWDASVSPSNGGNYPLTQNAASFGVPSSLEGGYERNAREALCKSFERAFRGSSMEYGSCPSTTEDLGESLERSSGIRSCRNSSTEFINFISGSQQVMSSHTEQQVAVEHQTAVGSRSFLKGLDVTWNDSRESFQVEKDNSLSSFELKLGQPSQQSQPVGSPVSDAANQMQRVMQRVLDTGRQQNMQSTTATSAAGLATFSGCQGLSSNRLFNQQNFETTTYIGPNHHINSRVDPSRGIEGNGSALVDQSSFKEIEGVSTARFVDNFRERENMTNRDAVQFSMGVRWPAVSCVASSFKPTGGLGMNSEHATKRWVDEAQVEMDGAAQAITQGQQNLDTVLGQVWMSTSRSTEIQVNESSCAIAGSEDQACCGENMMQMQRNSSLPYREVCQDNKEQFAYGDIATPRSTGEGQVCVFLNNGKAATTTMKGQILSKLREEDTGTKEADQEGKYTESDRQIFNNASSQGRITRDCSSPGGRRLRSFQDVRSKGCSCGANCTDEHTDQSCQAMSLAQNTHAPVSVADTEVGIDKRFLNQGGLVARSGLREYNETFQWKDMGGIFVSGNETLPGGPQDGVLSPQAPLTEDLLTDAATNVTSTVAISSELSDKQQPVSDIGSKSAENVMSGFSHGDYVEELSNADSVKKSVVGEGVVDESSAIGKCSSSDGVDMGIMPNLNMSSKDNQTKEASPSSQGYPSSWNAKKISRTKIKTRTRGCYIVKGQVVNNKVEGLVVDAGKVEKRRRRTMKWKSLDATIGAFDAKRQKLSPIVNVTESFDLSQKFAEGSDISNCLGQTNLVGISPSLCAKDSVTRAQKLILTQHNSEEAVNAGHGGEVNALNCTDPLHTDEIYLAKSKTLVIRVPRGVNRKKAKRSGRSKSGKIKMNIATQDDARCTKSTEVGTKDPAPVNNLARKYPAMNRNVTPELSVSRPFLKQLSLLEVGKTGRVVVRHPSPRNATRMVSLNDIMNKPEVTAFRAPKDHARAPAVNNVFSALQDGSRASASKEDLRGGAFRNGVKATVAKGGLKSFSRKCSLVKSGCMDGPRESLSAHVLKTISHKEALKIPALEGLKVKLCSSKDGLKARPAKDGLKVPFAKYDSKTLPKDGKDGSKALSSNESFKFPCSNGALKVSGSTASAMKDTSKEPAPKSLVRIPVTVDRSEVAALRASLKAVATDEYTEAPVQKRDVHVRASKNGLKAAAPKDFLKLKVADRSRLKNVSKTATLKDRLKTLASGKGLQNSFSFNIDIALAPRDASMASMLKDGPKPFAHQDSLVAPLKAETESKASRKPDPILAVAAASHYELSSQVSDAWKESKYTTKSHKQEARKVRSLYELIDKKSVPQPNTGVFEFHDEDMESSRILKQESVSRPLKQSDSTFAVPVRFTDSKCFVPRGERSPRGKFAKTKNLFWHRHKACNNEGRAFGAGPVEIVVDGLIQDKRLNAGTPVAVAKEVLSDAKVHTVIPRISSFQKNRTTLETNDGMPLSGHVASSLTLMQEVLEKGIMIHNRNQSLKRIAESVDMGNPLKKQKLLEFSGTSELRSIPLKIRHPLPTSVLTTAATSPIDVLYAEVKGNKMNRQATDNDIKISGKARKSQRYKWFDCQVPEGVVECCVCGSSISEFFNQIVCCSRCPVKVHQACYGVKKIPNSAWFCRTCKADATHPICVLCGYGGGAMTRAQKAVGFLKGLVKVWQEKINTKEKADISLPHAVGHSVEDNEDSSEKPELNSCTVRGKAERELVPQQNQMPCNTVSSGLADSTVIQWVHMVCALWMPGTRCLNSSTMGVFDVSGVAQSQRKLVCTICGRKGGACIQCRVTKCGTPFHPWCAHAKGSLQSEIVNDGSDQVGFYGKCLRHAKGGDLLNDIPDANDIVVQVPGALYGTRSSCARTMGYAGKLTLEERAVLRRQATRNGSASVSPEQVAAWLRINERKTCKARRFFKSANSDQKTDHREYLRFKQEQGWRRLSVYKSGIHALGLYTAEFIGRGEMVVEYIGEIVGLRVADKREADYHAGKRMQYQSACYLFRIDRERIIDATRKGGIARFVNHSCSPNCVAKVICVKNQSKVVFFAQRDIYAGEEITYDYQFNFEQDGDKIPCFCGSANCRGTLN